MKIYLIPAILPILFTFSCSNCLFDRTDDCEKHYEFTIPVSIYPARDTFHIGDTIWIECSLNNLALNNLDGNTVDVTNLALKLFAFMEKDTKDEFLPARDCFHWLSETGSLAPYGINYCGLNFKEDATGRRLVKGGFIPVDKGAEDGVFCLTFGYLRIDYEKYGLINDNCLDWIGFKFNTNEGRDSSKYWLLPDKFRKSVSPEGYNRNGGFAFRVVE